MYDTPCTNVTWNMHWSHLNPAWRGYKTKDFTSYRLTMYSFQTSKPYYYLTKCSFSGTVFKKKITVIYHFKNKSYKMWYFLIYLLVLINECFFQTMSGMSSLRGLIKKIMPCWHVNCCDSSIRSCQKSNMSSLLGGSTVNYLSSSKVLLY